MVIYWIDLENALSLILSRLQGTGIEYTGIVYEKLENCLFCIFKFSC